MPTQPKVRQHAIANDAMSTAATAAQLNAKSRAFSNTVAKANLAKASAAFSHAKQVASNTHQASDSTVTSE